MDKETFERSEMAHLQYEARKILDKISELYKYVRIDIRQNSFDPIDNNAAEEYMNSHDGKMKEGTYETTSPEAVIKLSEYLKNSGKTSKDFINE